jgi:hypothetical protein
MDQPKPQVKIEPPKDLTSQDAASIILVSILIGGLVFAAVYYLGGIFVKKAPARGAVSRPPAPEKITASQQRPLFTATDFEHTVERNMPQWPRQKIPSPFPYEKEWAPGRPQSERVKDEVSADDLLGIPSAQDYDSRCGPGYYGHSPCAGAQQSLIPNFSEDNNKFK